MHGVFGRVASELDLAVVAVTEQDGRHRCTEQPCTRLVDEVGELVDPYTHVERRLVRKGRREVAKHHRTDWPGLLDQLRDAVTPGSTGDDVPGLAVTESRPPLDVPALNALLRIEAESAVWVSVRLGLRFRNPDFGRHCPACGTRLQACLDLVGPVQLGLRRVHCCRSCRHPAPVEQAVLNLRQLLGTAGALSTVEHRQLCSTVHRWWTWARVESAWDAPARESRDPCPYCGDRTLRLRPDGTAAWCTECGEAWDSDSVGLLARMLTDAREQREWDAEQARERARAERIGGGSP